MKPLASDSTSTVTINNLTNKPISQCDEEIKPVTDKEQAVLFITFRIPFEAVKSNGKTVFNFRQKDIADLLYKWQHYEPIPVPDIRSVFDALKSFNSTVRD